MVKKLITTCKIIIPAFLIFLYTGCPGSSGVPEIKDGVLNLGNWDFSNQGIVLLGGEWNFYWNRFLVKDYVYTPGEPDGLVTVPGSWTKAKLHKPITIHPQGNASYSLKIMLPPGEHKLKLWIPIISYAYELYLIPATGTPRFITSVGKPSQTRKEYVPWIISAHGDMEVSGDCVLILQISNYDTGLNPGVTEHIFFGLKEDVDRTVFFRRQYDYIIQGGLFVISLFMFILFLLRRENRTPLWLGIFSLLMSFYNIVIYGYFQEIVYALKPFLLVKRLSCLLTPLAIITIIIYQRTIYKDIINKYMAYISYIISFLYVGITIFFPLMVFVTLLNIYVIIVFFIFVWAAYNYIKILIKNRSIITILSVAASSIAIITGIMDLLVVFSYIPGIRYFQLGVLVMILCHSIIVTFFIEENRRKAEQLSRDLEMKIIKIQHKGELADITTGILHNVKNLLTSLKISLEVVEARKIRGNGLIGFNKANSLLKEKMDNYKDFFCNDPRAMDLINYYLALEGVMENENKEAEEHFHRLYSKLKAIEQIISSQQKYGGRIRFETVYLPEIIEDALLIQASELREIKIQKIFEPHHRLILSRILLFHIIINIIKNAGEAMVKNTEVEKILTFKIQNCKEHILLKIRDTGCGITQENMDKMFSHGFTTKKTGNGYGLYSCKLYIEEMGGAIIVSSAGQGKGTEFTLSFKSLQEQTVDSSVFQCTLPIQA